MSIDEIRKLGTKERIILMNSIWESFNEDDIVYQSPLWHKEILNERMKKINDETTKFISLKQLRA